MKVTLVVLFCLILGIGSILAQTLPDVMFDLYVQSVLYPEQFDKLIQNNQNIFNQFFHSHLNCVMRRMLFLGKKEREVQRLYRPTFKSDIRSKMVSNNEIEPQSVEECRCINKWLGLRKDTVGTKSSRSMSCH